MEDLLVLGIIPNTNLEISFVTWVIFVQSLLLFILSRRWIHGRVAHLQMVVVQYGILAKTASRRRRLA